MTAYYLITFESTHLAMQAERLLKQTYKTTVIPTPRDLTASCGLSLMLDTATEDSALADLKSRGVEGMHLFRVTRSETGTRHYQELDWGI